ncbi:lysosomal beta glucosidase-like protein [Cinnamomum micranthum f. kanehirae]|uniref:Lysosomal beta glucosidase-like protein n=1 Tax=Cinnamomum micranthum f. kanehirae TaxID=337451 RepID=A0A3S3QT05_9MAGN|nr:lysosomal beta glucosidase-like protein [Cinnamomum micranthum f. kanehirae]
MMLLYRDPRLPIEARISDLLSRMTLAEKIGTNDSDRPIRRLLRRSVLNGGDSAPSPDWTPSMWADMVDGYQRAALSSRLGIPMIYGTDAVHGHNNVFGSTAFPHNISLGATRDADLVLRIGKATALEIRGTGIPYAFAPRLAMDWASLLSASFTHQDNAYCFFLSLDFYAVSGASSFKRLLLTLPPRVHSVYYRDEIGNISSSHLRRDPY